MNYNTYKNLYDQLTSRDALESLTSVSEYDQELLMVIYTQRVVRDATKRFYRVKRHSRRLHRQWRQGTSLVQLAQNHDFPPTLMALIVLEREGISKRQFWKLLGDLDGVKSERLSRELQQVCDEDLVYSPEGTEKQYERGAWGEEKLRNWLEARGIGFRSEEELRAEFDKTPDALLGEPLEYDGSEVHWVESKATFGDPTEIRRHIRRQLKPYVEAFGKGLVVYWFGYVKDVDLHLPPEVSISDGKDLN